MEILENKSRGFLRNTVFQMNRNNKNNLMIYHISKCLMWFYFIFKFDSSLHTSVIISEHFHLQCSSVPKTLFRKNAFKVKKRFKVLEKILMLWETTQKHTRRNVRLYWVLGGVENGTKHSFFPQKLLFFVSCTPAFLLMRRQTRRGNIIHQDKQFFDRKPVLQSIYSVSNTSYVKPILYFHL